MPAAWRREATNSRGGVPDVQHLHAEHEVVYFHTVVDHVDDRVQPRLGGLIEPWHRGRRDLDVRGDATARRAQVRAPVTCGQGADGALSPSQRGEGPHGSTTRRMPTGSQPPRQTAAGPAGLRVPPHQGHGRTTHPADLVPAAIVAPARRFRKPNVGSSKRRPAIIQTEIIEQRFWHLRPPSFETVLKGPAVASARR